MNKVIEWDWKDQIDFSELNDALSEFGVAVVEVPDTGVDSYAVVVGKAPITKEDAQKLYEERDN